MEPFSGGCILKDTLQLCVLSWNETEREIHHIESFQLEKNGKKNHLS